MVVSFHNLFMIEGGNTKDTYAYLNYNQILIPICLASEPSFNCIYICYLLIRHSSSITDCSQEVRHKCLVWNSSGCLVSQGVEDVESLFKFVADVQDRSYVSASVAIVWCWPNSHKVLVSEPVLEAVHDKLMGSCDQVDVVDVIEFWCYFWAEQPACSSRWHCPGFDVFWIRPHQVAEWSFMWNFHSSIDKSNLVNCLDFWWQSSVNTENLALNDSADSKVIEDLGTVFPWVSVSVLSNCLVIETIDSCDLSGLMVSSKQGDVCWVLHLEAQQELEGLDWVEASIYKITHENVSWTWDLSSLVE